MQFLEGPTEHGWGVVRRRPWHFVGLFDDDEVAQRQAGMMGADYIVRIGDHRAGTDEFVWNSADNPHHDDHAVGQRPHHRDRL